MPKQVKDSPGPEKYVDQLLLRLSSEVFSHYFDYFWGSNRLAATGAPHVEQSPGWRLIFGIRHGDSQHAWGMPQECREPSAKISQMPRSLIWEP